jgi:hypothetical protein
MRCDDEDFASVERLAELEAEGAGSELSATQRVVLEAFLQRRLARIQERQGGTNEPN